ncbi:MAG: alanyl-tRNA editing protein [Candidatus Lokiarchaeota archaeon]|nr:alanyl-tRNA editing protein [Candidatus Lokiarchaeota archaeon]
MTQKLYWDDPYKIKFTAKIVSIQKGGIVLDKTLFFPLSGNQANDKGILQHNGEQSAVNAVEIIDDDIIHYVSSDFIRKIKIGNEIIGKIDWEYRYGIMKAHSSQHIFSAIFLESYNAKTSRANIEYEEVSIQLDHPINEQQLLEGLKKLNEICTSVSKDITAEIYHKGELSKIKDSIRSEIPEKEEIRLIKIDNLDMVCCGGTHLKTSIEIGPVILTDFKKGTDIRYYIGKKALNLISSLNVDLINLSDKLNTSLVEVPHKIQSYLTELEENKQFIEILKTNNLELTSKYPIDVYKSFNLFLIKYQIDSKILKKNMEQFPSNSLLVIILSENRYQIVSLSEKVSANGVVQALIKKFGGKGGGSNFTAQANLSNVPTDLIIELRGFIDSI